jgi:signal transduction histidine kinase
MPDRAAQEPVLSSDESPPDFRIIFEALPGNYLVLTPGLVMVAANQARLKATMTTLEETIGRHLFDLFPDNPDDPAATGVANLKASLERVLATKTADTMAVQKYDVRRPESEGGGFEARFWSPVNSPVLDADGNVIYIIHRVEDVTDFIRLKQQDAEQTKLTDTLRAQIERTDVEVFQRAQELQVANQKLRELDRLKTDFFANVSHELRTPLTLILAPIEALLASGGDETTIDARRDILRTVHNNAIRLLQMINGLLDFSKVSAGKTEIHREAVQIVELTQSLLWDFRSIMQSKGIGDSLSATAPTPVVEMDRYLYERIVFNLLSNAVKFTPSGGRITVTLDVREGELVLSVSDTGIGIAPEDARLLFEKFHQVEGSSTRRFEGTGLGLALVKEFARLLDGTVTVASELGKGSTFTLRCKARAATAIPTGTTGPATHLRLPQPATLDVIGRANQDPTLPHIVVAEDNPELAAFIAELLSPLCQVHVATDGADALRLIRSLRPELVLSDVMMPRIDGIRLTQEIKADDATSGIPIVLLTAMTNRESLLKGWEAGADDYLFKPFHPKELEARVRSLLNAVQWQKKGEAFRQQRDALEQFTHIASHDLREPLRKVVNFVEIFKIRNPNLDEVSARYLGTVADSATRMYHLLDTLIEHARVEHAQFTPEPVDLRRLVDDVTRDLSAAIEDAGAEVIVGELPEIRAHPGQMAILFKNVMANSLKYRSSDRTPLIRISATRTDVEWILSVADNGIGFEPKHHDRIFIMFERLHGQETYSGDGMGLAICRRIVEQHGGRMWAESEPGRGAVFHFSLPATPSETGATST